MTGNRYDRLMENAIKTEKSSETICKIICLSNGGSIKTNDMEKFQRIAERLRIMYMTTWVGIEVCHSFIQVIPFGIR